MAPKRKRGQSSDTPAKRRRLDKQWTDFKDLVSINNLKELFLEIYPEINALKCDMEGVLASWLFKSAIAQHSWFILIPNVQTTFFYVALNQDNTPPAGLI